MTTIAFKASEQPLKSVTVFRSSTAEIVRSFTINLKAGQNTITISELSSCINMDSVRVSGLRAGTRLFDIVCTIGKSPSPAHNENEALQQLKRKKKQLEDQRELLVAGSKHLSQYANSLTAEHVKPDEALVFFDNVAKRKAESDAKIKKLVEEIAELDTRYWEELGKKEGDCRGRVSVVIVSKTDCTTELRLTYLVSQAKWEPCYDLFATTTDGQPSPIVTLHYCARITQKTGEVWQDATLVLSTASAQNVATSIPDIKALQVRRRQSDFSPSVVRPATTTLRVMPRMRQQAAPPPPPPPGFAEPRGVAPATSAVQQLQQLQQRAPVAGGGLFGTTPNVAPAAPAPPAQTFAQFGASQQQESDAQDADLEYDVVEEHNSGNVTSDNDAVLEDTASVVRRSPVATAYRVEGNATIPSDGLAHRVLLADLELMAVISHVCVPRVRAAAYIQCKVKNTSEYSLLAGPVGVMLDDSYVSKFSLPPTGPSDFFTCTLGVDTSLRISYKRSTDSQKDKFHTFAQQTKQTTVTVHLKIENRHTSPVSSLVVREAVPTSNDEEFKVVLAKPAGLSTADEGQEIDVSGGDGVQRWKARWIRAGSGKGGEKEGKFEWLGDIGEGKAVDLESEWVVSAPASATWEEVTEQSPDTFGRA